MKRTFNYKQHQLFAIPEEILAIELNEALDIEYINQIDYLCDPRSLGRPLQNIEAGVAFYNKEAI
jgi:hypothetical protein